jgi:DNA-binding transcriptional regulator LsrR (DeoR family)
MAPKSKKIPNTLKELAIAEFIKESFGKHSAFPSNEEIIDYLKSEFVDREVGPIYPKDITNLKRGAYKLLDITVALPRNGTLEVRLREEFDLDGAIVVGSPYKSYDEQVLRALVGYQAARFFDEHVRDGETVTFSCSLTIREMIKRIHGRYSNLQVFTDSVVSVNEFHVVTPTSLVVLFLDRFPLCRGTAYTLPPALVDMLGRDAVQEMLDQALFERAFNPHWFFVGIGALTQELSHHGITPGFDFLTHVVTHDAAALKKRGVVGEISYWPLNRSGEPVYRNKGEDLSYFRHVFTHSRFRETSRARRLDSRSRTRVVGAAGGVHKVAAIKAAVNYLDYLITDVRTAESLLE